ncbi:hypothetical protein H5410_025874 [Solanum commersonii]|uniref:Uncharacterized protein n=1 Tax=Solanum commersonii TaxID=4109 RepID=A0A9J5YZT0_SOLCO|nr:hypothetical protein H5410_025874 [Solanum commersonii]
MKYKEILDCLCLVRLILVKGYYNNTLKYKNSVEKQMQIETNSQDKITFSPHVGGSFSASFLDFIAKAPFSAKCFLLWKHINLNITTELVLFKMSI